MKFNLKRVGIIALCVIGVIMSLILFFSLAAFYILLCIAIVVIPVLLVMNAIDAWECHSYSTVTHTPTVYKWFDKCYEYRDAKFVPLVKSS